jgi:drug/metabolite transporter (DMT)-like permease
MAGYRDTAGYDPYVYDRPGRPMRPFNWVQWIGVGIGCVGAALVTLDVLGRLGWIPQLIGELPPSTVMLLVIGVSLVSSRREPATQMVRSEQLAKNRRMLLITTAIVVPILVAAAALDLLGAK